MTNRSKVPLHHTAFKTAVCASTLTALLAFAAAVQAQVFYDTFDTGGVNPTGWILFNNPSYPTSYTFPQTDAFGGYAFRMQGFPPTSLLGQGIPRGQTTARAGAICTNNVYTDFYVAADLLDWQTNWFEDTNYTFLGLAARVNASLAGIASGTNWSGVALFNWLNVNTDGNGPGTAIMGLGWVINGNVYFNLPPLGDLSGVAPAGIAEWTLEHGHTYRLTFQGVGNYLIGQVFDTQDLTRPLGTITGDTSLGQYNGLGFNVIAPAPTSGWSGMCAFRYSSNDTNGVTDATFDNFYAAVTPPTSVSAPATPHGLMGAPQVINRTPASWANFYSPAGGIAFDATTLTATNSIVASAIRLILNGVDVSSSLTISPTSPAPTNHVTFSLPAANTVYDASIILQDSFGRRTTNVWTFDTFTDAYLAQYPNIECEDYDYLSGSWNPFPVITAGFSTNDSTWYSPPGVPYPLGYTYPINSGLNPGAGEGQFGYVGLKGQQAANASDPAGDFYESARTYPLSGSPLSLTSLVSGFDLSKLLPACEYRTGTAAWPDVGNGATAGDAAGTEEGAARGLNVLNITTNAAGYLYANYTYDNKRQKYAALNAVGLAQFAPPNNPNSMYGAAGATSAPWWDVEEYNVVATEGSDWFNYTKNWGATTNYNVYLRAACALTQHIYLHDGATNSAASRLGTFWCTNALMWNWRYTRLLDANGNPAVASLGGAHTLRLEIDPEAPKFAAVSAGLALNYLAFVPATCVQVTINPPAAVAAGAQWALDGGGWNNSGALVTATPGSHTVSFKSGLQWHWATPANQNVTVTQNQTTSATGTYTTLLPTLWSTTQLKKSGTAWVQETGAIVNTNNQVVTNILPATSTYYELRWDINTKVTKVSKSGANLILNFTNAVLVTNSLGYQPGLNVRAWAGTSGTPIEGIMFDPGSPSPAPNDSTPYDALYFTNGLGTIGYATQSINMPNAGPQPHFTATDNCGVASPGPFPAGYAQNYAVEYRGQLYIATAGSYNFQTSSDDGSALWIDAGSNPAYSAAIVQNNAAQALTPKASGAQSLTAGYHDIVIRYNQGGGQNALQVDWDPTGGTSFVPIPGSVFFHQQSAIIMTGP